MSPTKVLKDMTVELQFTLPPNNNPVSLKLSVKKGQLLVDVVRHFMNENNVPCYLEISVLSVVESLLKGSWRGDVERNGKVTNDRQAEEVRKELIEKYQKHTVRYNDTPTEDIFPKAYHTLVHSPVPSIFDILLQLEQSFSQAMNEQLETRERELSEIRQRHGREMDRHAREMENNDAEFEFARIVSRHVEELEIAQAMWASKIDELQRSQKREYCEFVLKLYEAHQRLLNQNSNDPSWSYGINGKDIVLDVINELKSQQPKLSKEMLEMDNHESSSRSRHGSISSLADLMVSPTLMTPPSPRFPIGDEKKSVFFVEEDPAFQAMITSIKEIGFNAEQAKMALEMTNRNMDQAVNLLLEQLGKIDAQIAAANAAAPALPIRRPSIPISGKDQEKQANRRNKSHARNLSLAIQKPEKKQGWSPLSFLQERKQSMLTSNNNSTARKFGNWLGKAMENFGLDDGNEDGARGPLADTQLVESFTISLGNQVKSTHNLRLLVSDMDDLLKSSNDPARDMAYRAQTAANLYSQDLTAVVLLLTPQDWPKYKLGKSANKAFFERCKKSTEFHFDDVETQLKAIEEDYPSTGNLDAPSIREGDFFITKHSNLPLIHIVFHLVIDFESLQKSELNQRSPGIAGLRNILRTVNRFDITSISIPFLLLPSNVDAFSDPNIEKKMYNRGELVLKCTKGFMIENSRVPKHNVAEKEQETKTVQFLLPKSATEQQFHAFRHLLTSIFRAS
ncbi:7378_t:CDS:10 [Ambispora leptoticha]|uniref:7378_t:CDS:1 n=1 Tax=Ambispora leptoticha TaxID=144679 RepID=A0A9N8VZ04_9GLOM|nr:7378_t:CDS:10 [Ambispora leptoticha]